MKIYILWRKMIFFIFLAETTAIAGNVSSESEATIVFKSIVNDMENIDGIKTLKELEEHYRKIHKRCEIFREKHSGSTVSSEEINGICHMSREFVKDFQILVKSEELLRLEKYDEAQKALDEGREILGEKFYQMSSDIISKARRAPIYVSSHREMHKLTETGMNVTKEYRFFTKYYSDGNWLIDPNGKTRFDLPISVRPGFINVEKKRALYELRGKTGCFTVRLPLSSEYLEIIDFNTGSCQ